MGYNLKVLLPVDDRYDGDTLEEIHDDLINEGRLEYDLPTNFSHFSFWNMMPENDSFFGKDHPEKLIQIAEKWNEKSEKYLRQQIDAIANKSTDEILSYFAEDPFNGFHLKEALDVYHDHFCFGEDQLVYNKEGEYFIRIPEDVLKDVKEHPEDYAIVDVIYH